MPRLPASTSPFESNSDKSDPLHPRLDSIRVPDGEPEMCRFTDPVEMSAISRLLIPRTLQIFEILTVFQQLSRYSA